MSYIDIVLGGISPELFDIACEKINQMVKRMNKEILYNNKFVNDYEKSVYESCLSKTGISKLMQRIQEQKKEPCRSRCVNNIIYSQYKH